MEYGAVCLLGYAFRMPTLTFSKVLTTCASQSGIASASPERAICTLASFCKEQIAQSGEAEQLPMWLSDVVNTFDKVTVGIRKS